MNIVRYDNTFDGLLSVVFYSFECHIVPDLILRREAALPLFYDTYQEVNTDVDKAARVFRKLKKVLSHGALGALTTSFLCDDPSFDISIFRFICRAVTSRCSIERDFSDPDVLAVVQNCRKVRYEAHRILQFMRFQKAKDGTYFGMMEPIYNVMPMAIQHFRDRFSDSKFVIYDRCRDFGYSYDGSELHLIHLDSDGLHMTTGRLSKDIMDDEEELFQRMWRAYFKAIAIPERLNPRKQRQDMPVRFWKYLTEKQHS